MTRQPAVAGQFYPGNRGDLTAMIASLTPRDNPKPRDALAIVSPHAGYIYSGGVAAETFARVNIPEDVLILGPNHHGYGPPLSLMKEGAWEMPQGEVPISSDLSEMILNECPEVEPDVMAHRLEHSLEVQVPFLQTYQDSLRITPIAVSRVSYQECESVGKGLARAIKRLGRPLLMVASTDMTHYQSRETASRQDRMALEPLLELDPQGLYETVLGNQISMCGIIPTTIVLTAAIELGATSAELVRYTDSGETSGDINQVVGYAGVIVS